MPELELATTDEIVDELAKRFAGLVVIYEREVKLRDDVTAYGSYHRGGFWRALGLGEAFCARMKAADGQESELKEGA